MGAGPDIVGAGCATADENSCDRLEEAVIGFYVDDEQTLAVERIQTSSLECSSALHYPSAARRRQEFIILGPAYSIGPQVTPP